MLNKTVDELSPAQHPLIFAVNMSTGKQFHAHPTEVLPAPSPTTLGKRYSMPGLHARAVLKALRLLSSERTGCLGPRMVPGMECLHTEGLPSCTSCRNCSNNVNVLAQPAAHLACVEATNTLAGAELWQRRGAAAAAAWERAGHLPGPAAWHGPAAHRRAAGV